YRTHRDALSSPTRRSSDLGGPRGLEQAATAAGALRHAPAAERLVQLLSHDDPEVRVPAAWALRRLAVPATAAALLERARIDTERSEEHTSELQSRENLVCR